MIEQKIIKFINLARQYPSYFISLLDQEISSFVSQTQIAITPKLIYQTQQGIQHWKETRNFLFAQQSLPSLQQHYGLAKAAEDHAIDLYHNHRYDHTGSDNSTFTQRILKYCHKSSGLMAELISSDLYINCPNIAEIIVLGLIIDDGISERGHRSAIFNHKYKYIGCKTVIDDNKILTVINMSEKNLQLIKNLNSSINNNMQKSTNIESSMYSNPTIISKQQLIDYLRNTNQNYIKIQPTNLQKSISHLNLEHFHRRKISQKIQNMQFKRENGKNVSEKVTKFIFNDGTMKKNVEKHTYYS